MVTCTLICNLIFLFPSLFAVADRATHRAIVSHFQTQGEPFVANAGPEGRQGTIFRISQKAWVRRVGFEDDSLNPP